MRAFTSKGRFSDLLATMPVHVVMNPLVGLYGALMEAARLAGGKSA
jgi:glucokinase